MSTQLAGVVAATGRSADIAAFRTVADVATPTVPAPTEPTGFISDLAAAWGWVKQTPHSWRRPSWARRVASWAIVGVIGDAVTTSFLPYVEGIREGNPVAAAGQSAVGSVPLFMVLVTVPLVLTMALLANKPRNGAQWLLWSFLAFAGAVKLWVTLHNVGVLHSVLLADTMIVV